MTGNDRVILRGRADTLAAWTAQLERTTEPLARHVLTEHIAALESTMAHLEAGCEGPCRGNSALHPVCRM